MESIEIAFLWLDWNVFRFIMVIIVGFTDYEIKFYENFLTTLCGEIWMESWQEGEVHELPWNDPESKLSSWLYIRFNCHFKFQAKIHKKLQFNLWPFINSFVAILQFHLPLVCFVRVHSFAIIRNELKINPHIWISSEQKTWINVCHIFYTIYIFPDTIFPSFNIYVIRHYFYFIFFLSLTTKYIKKFVVFLS